METPKKQKTVSTLVHFETRSQMKRAFARSKKLHGNYGFSRYIRTLIDYDLLRAVEEAQNANLAKK